MSKFQQVGIKYEMVTLWHERKILWSSTFYAKNEEEKEGKKIKKKLDMI